MKNWIVLLLVFLVGLAIVIGLRAQEADTFPLDKASRVRWIDAEILELQLERFCVIKSRNRAEMRKCNR